MGLKTTLALSVVLFAVVVVAVTVHDAAAKSRIKKSREELRQELYSAGDLGQKQSKLEVIRSTLATSRVWLQPIQSHAQDIALCGQIAGYLTSHQNSPNPTNGTLEQILKHLNCP